MKRILLEHTQGPLKGYKRIVGTIDNDTKPPEYLAEGLEAYGVEFVSLISVHPRHVLYREAFRPTTGRFSQSMPQKDKPWTFDPRQG